MIVSKYGSLEASETFVPQTNGSYLCSVDVWGNLGRAVVFAIPRPRFSAIHMESGALPYMLSVPQTWDVSQQPTELPHVHAEDPD